MKLLPTFLASVLFGFTSVAAPTDEAVAPSPEQMFSRAYRFEAEMLVRELTPLAPSEEGGSKHDLLLRFLKENGVEISSPSALFVNERNGMVLVRASQNVLDQISALMKKATDADFSSPDDVLSVGQIFEAPKGPTQNSFDYHYYGLNYDDGQLMRRYEQDWQSYLKSRQSGRMPVYNPSRIDSLR
jgi:hypothetical protein